MRRLATLRRTRQALDPIVVFGAPRSGTSYLNRLLNQHPRVYISEEARLFLWVHHSLSVLGEDRRFVRKHKDEFIDHIRSNYPELIRGFYRKLRPTARYWGDKNPAYAARGNEGCLETIQELFPGTRFIHIIRDGRDVVTSLLRTGWASFDQAHRIWMTHVGIGSQFGARCAEKYLELRYEEVVRDDLEGARRIFDFLGIEMHQKVIEFCREQQRERTLVKRPTRDLRLGVATSEWGRFFAPDQQLKSLDLIGSRLLSLGYETESSLKDAREKARQRVSETGHPIREIVKRAVPGDATVIVMSNGDDELVRAMDGRRALHFPQREGGHNIPIKLDAIGSEAVPGLERLQARGGNFLLVPSTAYRWLEERNDFRRHVDAHYRRIWADDNCLIYELTEEGKAP
jgi:hypothetical protein